MSTQVVPSSNNIWQMKLELQILQFTRFIHNLIFGLLVCSSRRSPENFHWNYVFKTCMTDQYKC